MRVGIEEEQCHLERRLAVDERMVHARQEPAAPALQPRGELISTADGCAPAARRNRSQRRRSGDRRARCSACRARARSARRRSRDRRPRRAAHAWRRVGEPRAEARNELEPRLDVPAQPRKRGTRPAGRDAEVALQATCIWALAVSTRMGRNHRMRTAARPCLEDRRCREEPHSTAVGDFSGQVRQARSEARARKPSRQRRRTARSPPPVDRVSGLRATAADAAEVEVLLGPAAYQPAALSSQSSGPGRSRAPLDLASLHSGCAGSKPRPAPPGRGRPRR